MISLNKSPETNMDAVILGLFLSLTAPNAKASQEVVKITEGIARGMTNTEIAYAKEQAEAHYRSTERDQS
tara:strand:+ start:758 stop:967 length:210 start_codon:yes stop_codon:yes gene_type:complete